MTGAIEQPSDPTPPDHDLMLRVAQGDRDALAALVRRHQARVLTLAFRFLGKWDAAEDVCQDAFLRVFHSAASYRPEARFTTWLYRIVANLCWDYRRRAARYPRLSVDDAGAPPAAEGQLSTEQLETQHRIRQAIAQLPDRQRLAVLLHRFEGMSHAEIAEVTGWSPGAVESCIVRAYTKLRELLADLHED